MSNKPNSGHDLPAGCVKGILWVGAASLALACGTTATAENTALLARCDLSPDGVINWRDLNMFLSAFAKRSAVADVNGDGAVTDADTNAFLSNMGKQVGRAADPSPPAASPPASGSPAPPAPPASPAPTGEFTATLGTNSLDFAQGSRVIMAHNGPLWRPATRGASADASIVNKDNGFDLVFRMHNEGRRAEKLGSVVLDGFRLGQALKVRDFRAAGVDIALTDPAAEDIREGLSYPSEWYSPVMVLQSDAYTLGVSLEYPVLEYKHEAKLSVTEDASKGEQRIVIELNDNDGVVGYSKDGELRPGEQRQYVVSVRVLPASEPEWVNVLEPYKEYFTELYGRARYTRDSRPVHAAVMATPSEQNRANPGGFLFDDLRPDVHGFGPWAKELEARAEMGWERFMLWRVSGLPSDSRGRNTGCGKFDFATALTVGAAIGRAGPMYDAFTVLPRFDTRGRDLGMWWGDPLRVHNSTRRDDLDPTRDADVEAAIREAQTAKLAGAETIGLDSFNAMPAWKAYPFLDDLRASTPGVQYITEPACGDLLHTLAGALLIAQAPEDAPSAALDTRFFLADYLLPGHETWGLIRVDRMGGPTDDGIREEIFRLAERGYVPVVVPPVQVDRRIVAEETWRDPAW